VFSTGSFLGHIGGRLPLSSIALPPRKPPRIPPDLLVQEQHGVYGALGVDGPVGRLERGGDGLDTRQNPSPSTPACAQPHTAPRALSPPPRPSPPTYTHTHKYAPAAHVVLELEADAAVGRGEAVRVVRVAQQVLLGHPHVIHLRVALPHHLDLVDVVVEAQLLEGADDGLSFGGGRGGRKGMSWRFGARGVEACDSALPPPSSDD
jgi:hypothetical protein